MYYNRDTFRIISIILYQYRRHCYCYHFQSIHPITRTSQVLDRPSQRYAADGSHNNNLLVFINPFLKDVRILYIHSLIPRSRLRLPAPALKINTRHVHSSTSLTIPLRQSRDSVTYLKIEDSGSIYSLLTHVIPSLGFAGLTTIWN